MNINEVFGQDVNPVPFRVKQTKRVRVFTIVADTQSRFGGLDGAFVLMDLNYLRNDGHSWGPADNRVYLTPEQARQLASNLTTLADSIEYQQAVQSE